MRMVLPVLLLLAGLAGGVGAGLVIGSGGGVAEEAAAPDDAPDVSDDAEGALPEEDGEDGGLVIPAGEGTEYVRLRNQFIVPVVRQGSVRSLVVLALTVEVTTGDNDAVFQHEPRLRDSFLRVLFAHANAGGFDGRFTEAAAMAPLRDGLREAAIAVLGPMARDVLIVDITRQDA
jgi:hypothetical protein